MFGGLRNDIKRKLPWYWSDFKDAFVLQSIASIFFLYFACLTPIITFGGLLGSATGNNIVSVGEGWETKQTLFSELNPITTLPIGYNGKSDEWPSLWPPLRLLLRPTAHHSGQHWTCVDFRNHSLWFLQVSLGLCVLSETVTPFNQDPRFPLSQFPSMDRPVDGICTTGHGCLWPLRIRLLHHSVHGGEFCHTDFSDFHL